MMVYRGEVFHLVNLTINPFVRITGTSLLLVFFLSVCLFWFIFAFL